MTPVLVRSDRCPEARDVGAGEAGLGEEELESASRCCLQKIWGVLALHHVTSVPASQGCSICQEVKRIVLPPSVCRPLHFLFLTEWNS